ncbi:MAG: Gfo/Idh/MocA family oxidoreductase [Henriciella sp.]|nr:Gfo/Idh/MocA family oxidoreductase [Henriciella sp.]
MADVKKYGVIGTGMMGREHIRNLALVPGAQLVAISDPHEPSLQAALDTSAKAAMGPVKAYTDYNAMLDQHSLDAIIIATPNHTHFDIAAELLDEDIALLVEKPLCTTVTEASQLVERVKTRNALFWTGLEYRYMPPVASFIDRIHEGEIGRLQMLSIREHRFPFLRKIGNWNRFSRNTGGTMVEKCCHFFDLMRLIVQSEPVRIYASGAMDVNHLDEQYDGDRPDIIDNAYAVVDFRNGVRANLDLCMFANGSEQQEEICAIGDTAKLEVAIPSGLVSYAPRVSMGQAKQVVRHHVETDPSALAAGYHHGATYYQLLAFQAALVNGAAPVVSALDGLRSVAMGAAAHQSIETGQAVDLDLS